MNTCHAASWLLLGANLSMYVLMTAIALWRTRDMLRDSSKGKKPEKEGGDGE